MSTVPGVVAHDVAAAAWRELSPGSPEPSAIDTLKDAGFPLNTFVCRLSGTGRDGASVVAKWCSRKKAAVEKTVYEQVLPALPLHSAHYYGAVPGPGSEFCWLFLEDIGDEPVSTEHRAEIARWLAGLHTAAAALPNAAGLPGKGLSYYLEIVQTSQSEIAETLRGHELDAEQREVLTGAVDDLEYVEEFWEELADLCAGLPETVLHGDFVDKNLFVDPAGSVVVLDWGSAGWGVPATDLRYVDAAGYCAGVSAHWPDLSVQSVERAASAGHVFSRIARLRGVTGDLPARLRSLKDRRRKLAEALRGAGLLLMPGLFAHLLERLAGAGPWT